VQSNNFTTLFVLSREREVEDSVLDVSIVMAEVMCGVALIFILTGLDCKGWPAGFQLGQRDQK
jgi:hypothetical protein